MEYSRKEYCHRLPFSSPGDLPGRGINPRILHCRWILYHLSHQGRQNFTQTQSKLFCEHSSLPQLPHSHLLCFLFVLYYSAIRLSPSLQASVVGTEPFTWMQESSSCEDHSQLLGRRGSVSLPQIYITHRNISEIWKEFEFLCQKWQFQ